MFRTAISLFELDRLDDLYPFDTYAVEHALCLIDWGDMLSANRIKFNESLDERHQHGPCEKPYEKAIEIIKSETEYEVSRMKSRPVEQHLGHGDFIKSLVDKVDVRLRKSKFASSYCGILPAYYEESLKSI